MRCRVRCRSQWLMGARRQEGRVQRRWRPPAWQARRSQTEGYRTTRAHSTSPNQQNGLAARGGDLLTQCVGLLGVRHILPDAGKASARQFPQEVHAEGLAEAGVHEDAHLVTSPMCAQHPDKLQSPRPPLSVRASSAPVVGRRAPTHEGSLTLRHAQYESPRAAREPSSSKSTRSPWRGPFRCQSFGHEEGVAVELVGAQTASMDGDLEEVVLG